MGLLKAVPTFQHKIQNSIVSYPEKQKKKKKKKKPEKNLLVKVAQMQLACTIWKLSYGEMNKENSCSQWLE